MTDTHLNALLDRYLHKYIPANHPAQQQHRAAQQQQQQQTQAQSAYGAASSASFAPASTIGGGGGSSLHSSVFNSTAAAPASSYAPTTAAPVAHPQSQPQPHLGAPSDLYGQTDLSLIQSQIDSLSKKLQRPTGADAGSSQAASELAQLQASMQSNPAARAAFPLMTQPQPIVAAQPQPQQMQMHDLDQSMFRGGNAPPPLQPASFTQAQTTQNYLQAHQSINSSIQAFSPPRATAAAAKQQQQLQQLNLDMTAAAADGSSFGPVPYPSPSGGAVRAQLTAANKQIAKQSGLLSERDFQLASAQRELTSLRSRFDAARTALESHQSLVSEHAALSANLARSEKIRREQLDYIQMLHAQINFLQNSNASIRASPIKARHNEQGLTSPSAEPQHQQLSEQPSFAAHPPASGFPTTAHSNADYNASQSFMVPAAAASSAAPSAVASASLADYESKWDAAATAIAAAPELDHDELEASRSSPSRSMAHTQHAASISSQSQLDAAEIASMVRDHAAASGFQPPRAAANAPRRAQPLGPASARPSTAMTAVAAPRSRTGFGSSSHKKPLGSASASSTPRVTAALPSSAASSFSSNRGSSAMAASSQKKKSSASAAPPVQATPQRSSSRPPSSFGSAVKPVRPSSSTASSRANSMKKPAATATRMQRDHFV